jgi:hypothetical protein
MYVQYRGGFLLEEVEVEWVQQFFLVVSPSEEWWPPNPVDLVARGGDHGKHPRMTVGQGRLLGTKRNECKS